MATNEDLQQELDTLRRELRQLRGRIERLPEPQAEPGRTLSRRNLLRVAPIAAVGSAMAVMSAGPAAAAEGDPVLQAKQNDAGASKTTTITGGTDLPVEGVPAGSPAAVAYTGGLSGDWLETSGVAVGLDTGAALSVGASYLRGLAAHFAGPGVPTSHGQSGADAVLIDCTGPGSH